MSEKELETDVVAPSVKSEILSNVHTSWNWHGCKDGKWLSHELAL